MDRLLKPEDVANILCVSKRHFLERIATRPEFPPRIKLSRKSIFWKDSEVQVWIKNRQEKRPHYKI